MLGYVAFWGAVLICISAHRWCSRQARATGRKAASSGRKRITLHGPDPRWKRERPRFLIAS